MMKSTTRSPRITHISWGRMEIEGIGSGKDFKLYPGEGESGTGRKQELNTFRNPAGRCIGASPAWQRGHRSESAGWISHCRPCSETLDLLRDRGIPVHVEETRAAVERYNKLATEKLVGGLFHSTC
jgi:hypothetical protein